MSENTIKFRFTTLNNGEEFLLKLSDQENENLILPYEKCLLEFLNNYNEHVFKNYIKNYVKEGAEVQITLNLELQRVVYYDAEKNKVYKPVFVD